MSDLTTFVEVLYAAVVAPLVPFGLHRLHLTWVFLRTRRGAAHAAGRAAPPAELPRVTVQLPVYDERYVIERAIRAACALDYPPDRLEIQVLDDSSDETSTIAARVVAELRDAGRPVLHVRRDHREGFKAGALAHGLACARGELIAIFDADFTPAPDVLHHLVAPFCDARVGMVQARWGHANRDDSLLTRLESVLLDGHFVVEHSARHASGRFFNFNGTAGMWRREAIESAGGWQHDTLTEDLDLSYRAQLAGWRFVYLPEVVVPGEVPPDMAGFRSQQRRWAMGSAQTLRKLAPRLVRARVPLAVKLEALAHLGGNVAYLASAASSVLLAPALLARALDDSAPRWLVDLPLLGCGLGSVGVFYAVSQVAFERRGAARWRHVPLALGLAASLSLTNAAAVLRGLRGDAAAFQRTPKYGSTAGAFRASRYRLREPWPWPELAVTASCAVALAFAIAARDWLALPFVAISSFGYGYACWRLTWEGRTADEAPARTTAETLRELAARVRSRASTR